MALNPDRVLEKIQPFELHMGSAPKALLGESAEYSQTIPLCTSKLDS